VSSDGRWLAYQATASGLARVHVRPFDRAGGTQTVSGEGGRHPVRARDGSALYFIEGNAILRAPIVASVRHRRCGAAFAGGYRHVLRRGARRPAARRAGVVGARGRRAARRPRVEIAGWLTTIIGRIEVFAEFSLRVGVREYWTIDPDDNAVHVHRFGGPGAATTSFRPCARQVLTSTQCPMLAPCFDQTYGM
jgi:hypothetical protein